MTIFSVNIKNKNSQVVIFCLLFLVVLFLFGLRDKIGSDWESYKVYYLFSWKDKIDSISDIGFNLLSQFFYNIGVSFNYFIFFVMFIMLFPIFIISKKYKYSILVLFLYSTLYLPSLMGLMRQAIAVSFCLVAVDNLYRNNNKNYFIYLIIAATFHVSALVVVFLYFFKKLKINLSLIIISFLMSFLLNIFLYYMLPQILVSNDIWTHDVKIYFTYYNVDAPYVNKEIYSFLLMYVQKIIFLIYFHYYVTKICYNERFYFYFKIYFFSLIFNSFFILSLPILAIRGSIYFSIVEIFLLAYSCEKYKYRNVAVLLVLTFGGVKFFKILYSSYNQFVPYQFFTLL